MIRWLAAALLLVGSAAGQFVEIQVDAATHEGRIRPTFGIDAPENERQARLLLESGASVPVRLGPSAALRARLAETLEGAWTDDVERVAQQDVGRGEPAVWTFELSKPDAELAEAVTLAIGLQEDGPAVAYYRRRGGLWFDEEGQAEQVFSALALASRMGEAPRRVRLEVGAGGAIQGLAGVSDDGEAVRILLSRNAPGNDANDELPAYVVYVRNLPWGAASFRTERYRVDGEHAGELLAEGSGRGGLVRISAQFQAPAVELIVLRRQDEPAGSGVLRRRGVRPSRPR